MCEVCFTPLEFIQKALTFTHRKIITTNTKTPTNKTIIKISRKPLIHVILKGLKLYRKLNHMRLSKICLLLTGAFFSSCGSVMYVPTMQSVPMLKEKGEIHATGTIRNYQIAYAATSNIGILLNGFYLKDKFTFGSTDDYFDFKRGGYQLDAGAGTYKKISQQLSAELFAGAGWGHAYSTHGSMEAWPIHLVGGTSDFYKCYLQPNLIFGRIGFSSRLQYVNFYNYKEAQNNLVSKAGAFLIDPAITLKLGNQWIHSVFQIQYSIPISPIHYHYQGFSPMEKLFLCSIGVELRLDNMFTKHKKEE
jgi:hypothetical protein